MKSITQEDIMGCGIACVAYSLKKSYPTTKKMFSHPEYASTKGYSCKALINVLNKKAGKYKFAKATEKNKSLLNKNGTIVLLEKSKKYPSGHYLIKTKKGWMNPWINLPKITPAKSAFQENLPGRAQWLIYKS